MDWIDDQNEKAEQDFWEAEAIFSEQKREFLERIRIFAEGREYAGREAERIKR